MKRSRYNSGMDDFNKDFNSTRNIVKIAFIAIFSITLILIITQIAIYFWVGSKVVDEVNSKDNNGSIARTLGHFYKEFKSASDEEGN